MKARDISNIAYIGWDNLELSSIRERESIFSELRGPSGLLIHIPWAEKSNLAALMEKIYKESMEDRAFPAGLICADGELGVALKKVMLEHGREDKTVVSIDDFPAARDLSLSVYIQPFEQLAREVYQCLLEQNRHANQWKASVRVVKGNFVER